MFAIVCAERRCISNYLNLSQFPIKKNNNNQTSHLCHNKNEANKHTGKQKNELRDKHIDKKRRANGKKQVNKQANKKETKKQS